MSTILTATMEAPPADRREILRYAGCRAPEPETERLVGELLAELEGKLSYRVCWREVPLRTEGATCRFGEVLTASSASLSAWLSGCDRALIFAATVGVEPDRLIARYGRTSPARALIVQAIGTERIEALCDAFCEKMAKENASALTARFSPGYGDLPLEVQKDLFAILDCPRKLGISLTDSLVMSPTKSVTAFVGIRTKGEPNA